MIAWGFRLIDYGGKCRHTYLPCNKNLFLRQHRTIIVVRLRRQIFRQIVQILCSKADAFQIKFVQDDGKYASKRAAKALAVNCAVLP